MYAQNTLENKQLPWVNTLKFNVGKTEFFFFLLPGIGQTYPRPGLEPAILLLHYLY